MTTDDEPQTLYRFKRGRRLLYVGISNKMSRRIGEHRRAKPWFTEATSITLKTYPDRDAVLAAEERAIKRERPLYNLVHNHRVEVEVVVSAEDIARNAAGLGMLICAGLLGARWVADAAAAWWIQQRPADGGPVRVPGPRNPFAESPEPVLVTMFKAFWQVADSGFGSFDGSAFPGPVESPPSATP